MTAAMKCTHLLSAAILCLGSFRNSNAQGTPPARTFRDTRNHLTLKIPAGWTLSTRDGEVSTFHLDARSAPVTARLRAVASIADNPFPLSTFSGAFLYLSVTPAANDASCAKQAPDTSGTKQIAGQTFAHGHAEQASRICTESRDDIYTAYHRHACYRFDLVTNTFCRQVSGAKDMTPTELDNIHQRMESILSSVVLQ
jgi:hypothetical protein